MLSLLCWGMLILVGLFMIGICILRQLHHRSKNDIQKRIIFLHPDLGIGKARHVIQLTLQLSGLFHRSFFKFHAACVY